LKIKDRIVKLNHVDIAQEGRILTIYMNTEPTGSKQDAWRTRLKNGLKRLGEYAEAEGVKEHTKQYEQLQKLVEQTVEDNILEMKRSWVLVAGASSGILLFETLQIPVTNAFYWEDKLHLEELYDLMNIYPPIGIVQVGGEEVTVSSSFLGELEQKWEYEWDLEQEDWREFKGISHANRVASGSSHKEQYNDRYEDNRSRWLKGLCPILEKHGKQHLWDEIVLTGEKNLTTIVSKEMNFDTTRILPKNLNGNSSHQVLQAVYASM